MACRTSFPLSHAVVDTKEYDAEYDVEYAAYQEVHIDIEEARDDECCDEEHTDVEDADLLMHISAHHEVESDDDEVCVHDADGEPIRQSHYPEKAREPDDGYGKRGKTS